MAFERTGDGPLLVIETKWARVIMAEIAAFCFLLGATVVAVFWIKVDTSASHALKSCQLMSEQAEAIISWDTAVLETMREDHVLPRFAPLREAPEVVVREIPMTPALELHRPVAPPADGR